MVVKVKVWGIAAGVAKDLTTALPATIGIAVPDRTSVEPSLRAKSKVVGKAPPLLRGKVNVMSRLVPVAGVNVYIDW